MILADKIKSMTLRLVDTSSDKDDDITKVIVQTIKFIRHLPDVVQNYLDKISGDGDHVFVDDYNGFCAKYSSGSEPYNGIMLYQTLFSSPRLDPQSFQVFKRLLPEGIVKQKEWEALDTLSSKVHSLRADSLATNFRSFLYVDSQQLVEAAKDLHTKISDEDIMVFVGNTPQLLRYAVEKLYPSKAVQLISLGVSGHPDNLKYEQPSSLFEALLTEQAHGLYKEYIQNMGITKESVVGHKIHFVDHIGSGGGIIYQMKAISEIAFGGDMGLAAKSFKVTTTSGGNDMEFAHKDSVIFDKISDDYYSVCSALDQATDVGPDRLMPNSSAYKWDDREFMELLEYQSKHIFKINEDTSDKFNQAKNEIFQPLFCSIDEAIAADPSAWSAGAAGDVAVSEFSCLSME